MQISDTLHACFVLSQARYSDGCILLRGSFAFVCHICMPHNQCFCSSSSMRHKIVQYMLSSSV